ncbi:MAG: metallophosphoesterase family protein [Peptococcaceae bacterium]|nr:metallophosphoesterase family protein [Peptococcaceae bacterium]
MIKERGKNKIAILLCVIMVFSMFTGILITAQPAIADEVEIEAGEPGSETGAPEPETGAEEPKTEETGSESEAAENTAGKTGSKAKTAETKAGVAGFEAEMLTLTPGSTVSRMNFTWYSDRGDPAVSVVQVAKKSDMSGGKFPADKAITATGTAGDASDGKSWHKASVAGLVSSTEYVYCVSDNGTDFSKVYSFKTGAAGFFSFAVTGDPQLTTGSQDVTSSYQPGGAVGTTKQGWQDTVSAIKAKGVNFIAGVGDQVDMTSNGSEAEYANFFAPSELRSIPYAPAVGNHDRHYLFNYHFSLPNLQNFAPVINAGNATNQQYQDMEVAGNYYYLYNNALFVVLNDAGYPESKEVAANYSALYDQTLQAATQDYAGRYDWVFVQHHKSTASVADHVADRDIQYYVEAGFEKLMDKYGVDFVLAGHDHVYARSYPMYDGVPDKTGASGVPNVGLIQGGDGASSAHNPKGTIYFTSTTGSGLKYYELFNNAGNLYVKDNLYYPYLVNGKVGSLAYMEKNLPLSTAKYLQNKTPGYLLVKVKGNQVNFEYYDLSNQYKNTPYDTYTVSKDNGRHGGNTHGGGTHSGDHRNGGRNDNTQDVLVIVPKVPKAGV